MHLERAVLERLQHIDCRRRPTHTEIAKIINGKITDSPYLVSGLDRLNCRRQISAQRRRRRQLYLVECFLDAIELPEQHKIVQNNERAIAVTVESLTEIRLRLFAFILQKLFDLELVDAPLDDD